MIFRRIFGKDEYFLENKTQKAIIVKFLKIDWLDYSKIKYFILSKYTVSGKSRQQNEEGICSTYISDKELMSRNSKNQ